MLSDVNGPERQTWMIQIRGIADPPQQPELARYPVVWNDRTNSLMDLGYGDNLL